MALISRRRRRRRRIKRNGGGGISRRRRGGLSCPCLGLEVVCAVLAGLHILMPPPPSSCFTLPKNSRRHRMPQYDYSIHDYEEESDISQSVSHSHIV